LKTKEGGKIFEATNEEGIYRAAEP
jgi:hypothetical protein